MNIGTQKWHESLSDIFIEVEALGGILAALVLLIIAFTFQHLLHAR